MARAKNERNKQFIEAWKEEGSTDRELQERFGLSPGGVKGLKARLRAKDDSLYEKIPASKDRKVTLTSAATPEAPGKVKPERKKEVTATSTSTKRMTFWLPEDIIERIKGLAAREKRTASAILREVLGKYLQNK